VLGTVTKMPVAAVGVWIDGMGRGNTLLTLTTLLVVKTAGVVVVGARMDVLGTVTKMPVAAVGVWIDEMGRSNTLLAVKTAGVVVVGAKLVKMPDKTVQGGQIGLLACANADSGEMGNNCLQTSNLQLIKTRN